MTGTAQREALRKAAAGYSADPASATLPATIHARALRYAVSAETVA